MVIRKPSRSLLIGLGSAALAVVFACGFDPPAKNPNPPKGGGSCSTEPGSLPPASCDNSLNDCSGAAVCTADKTSGCCKIEEKCGDQSTCMPMSDNKGKTVLDLRMRRLNVAAPASLAEPFIQNVVVTKNLDLKANGRGGSPACGEDGLGAFNWLLRIDKTANTLTTGGAPPTSDPFTKGYCFYKQQRGSLLVEAASGPIRFNGNTFEADPIDKLNVPIFVGGDINNVVVLPISNATIKDVTLSNDDNCVGSFNPAGVERDCSDDPSACQKWKTAGALGGYLTLEEADGVEVKDLNSSLCVVLTKAQKNAENKCPRVNGKIELKGDYCSTTKTKGDCADSFWLAATFAASAAIIHDGADVPECQGKSSGDAGTDAPADAPVDSPADAPADAPQDAPTEGG